MHAERRLSITTRPCADKPRMLKRRSLDFGSLFYHHEVAGNMGSNMGAIAEDNSEEEDNDDDAADASEEDGASAGPLEGTWAMETREKERLAGASPDLTAFILRAEQEMEQMDLHLHKLEDFLDQPDDEDDDSA